MKTYYLEIALQHVTVQKIIIFVLYYCICIYDITTDLSVEQMCSSHRSNYEEYRLLRCDAM
jgi:hypothetical protein